MNRIQSNRCPSSPRAQRGVGLVEVLIAVVVLAFGLLGIAAMQLTALRNSQSALERSQAVAQTYAILDAMRANDDRAIKGDYNIPETCAVPNTGDIVANDLHHWMETMRRNDVLGPNACGTINCTARECTITVSWDDSRAGGLSKEPVKTTTQL